MKTWQPFTQPPLDPLLTRAKDNASESELFFRRALVLVFTVFLSFLAVASRLVYLQVLNHERFTTLSDSNRVRLQPLPPTRGFIFDRNGVLLADNLASYHLEVTREQVKNLDATLAELRERIALTDADIERFRKLARRSPPYAGVPLRFQLTDEEIAKLAIDLYRLPGVDIKADLTRRYPLGPRAVHAIGYVGRIDEGELSRLDPGQYSGSTHIGKTGAEKSYEAVLHGRTGYQQVETNADGRPLRVLSRTPPTPGQHIYLSIDIRLQAVAEKLLEGYNGAIVALDPRNGEVLALASQPIYDPNLFVNGIDFASYRALNTSKDRPLLNRALRGVYPPGSTIKPLMALAGLNYGVVNRYSGVFCPGFYRLPGVSRKFRDWKHSGHGSVDMDRAIAQSCDVYFYNLALNLGIDRIHEFLDQFSMGRPIGIDLPGEKGALLPSQEWKNRVHKQPWFAGDTLSAGIGQGYFLATPLQLAHAVAVISQQGKNFAPRILYATEDPGTRAKTLEAPRPLPPVTLKNPRYWDAVIAGMIHVVEGGTAHRIGIGAQYRIAGKTGTAQVFTLGQNQRYSAKNLAKHLLDHALFIAFAPTEEPRIAVAVIAEHGGGGSATAAPLARKVMDAWLLDKYDDSITTGIPPAQDVPPHGTE
ncbi:MAG: penicillin-binding protein 2 [Candidatus Competibacteraceae bacterium]|uniref:Peptidoglycan D,D-transpeptidase MrdA n=1 Tax=Candidatus Contendobacter odensis Run_B_J11 TaxID=1400861 RepID=A0A7U7GB05_9GAMM|nr:penicillin-binding protein 2 [Candidatus Contendobacter odensis]MBK8537808.1 penicillin-binding protein 2 [Candidatus Competibacteraceae bacterium]MBK8750769.1 penicillin-binding protein 2 [Candidatus Competibacteraceae bacterium]CDH45021.1 cell elongation-specific transpeptidase of penicillin-binding protein 2 (peptidoglycan synthetase) [Candidatus Contendobacter odensis Run_B_J11]